MDGRSGLSKSQVAVYAGLGVVLLLLGVRALRGAEKEGCTFDVVSAETGAPDPERAGRLTAEARERGLLLMTASGYVIRTLMPLVISDTELDRGLAILADAAAANKTPLLQISTPSHSGSPSQLGSSQSIRPSPSSSRSSAQKDSRCMERVGSEGPPAADGPEN